MVATTKDEVVTFEVKVNTNGQSVQEIAFYLDIPDSIFTVLDEIDGTVDNKPFQHDSSAFFFSSVTVLEDTLIPIAADTVTRLNFRKFRISGGVTGPISDTTVARFRVRAIGTNLVRVTESNINWINNVSDGRVTQLTNLGQALATNLANPAMRIRTAPRGRISGNVPLEGRTDFTKAVTIELREVGNFLPITSSLFNSSNDQDSSIAGLQITTDASGFYELTQVPTGTYNVVAKTSNYLVGQYPTLEVVAGDLKTGINPTRDDAATPNDHQELRGGDVSSGNATGVQDNRVDSDDTQFMVNNFNTTVTAGAAGDINGDASINFQDLLIVAGNVSEEGVAPVFNKQGGKSNDNAVLKLNGIPDMITEGGEFEVSVMVNNINDLKAYTFTLRYDNDMVALVEDGDAIIDGDFLYSGDQSARSLFFTKDDRKGLIFVNTLLGNAQTAQGGGELLVLRFKAIHSGPHPDIALTDVQLANSVNEITSIGDVEDIPTDFALLQNYPNPFNPETRIRFQLPEASRVVLKVYNILGQEVRTLVNDQMKAGFHNLMWDGRNGAGLRVASGVYIYRIKAGNFKSVKKMVMLK